MRFECDSCHAKYRIADEKVAGRVVRFPCRKCQHKILIDGRHDDVTVPAGPAYGYHEVTRRSEQPSPFAHEAATAKRRPASARRHRTSSVPPRRPASVARRVPSAPAAATSAFVGQHPGLAPPLPSAAKVGPGPFGKSHVDEAEWHVSINDVPVGPIRLEEMAHKVDAGAVSEYSLVWREGFDEWRPLATVPELMSLLYERRSSGPPVRSRFSSLPPFVEAKTAIKETPVPPSIPAPARTAPPLRAMNAGATGSSSVPAAVPPYETEEFMPLADSLQPEPSESFEVTPLAELESSESLETGIEPAPPIHATPSSGAFSGLPEPPDEPVPVPSVPPQPAVDEPQARTSPFIWVLLVAVAVFSGVVAVLAFERYGDVILDELLGASGQPLQPAPSALPPSERTVEQQPEPIDDAQPAETEATAADTEAIDGADDIDEEADEAAAADGEPDPELIVEPLEPADDGPVMKPARPRRRARAKRSVEPDKTPAVGIKKLGDSSLSDEEQKMLADFGSGAKVGVAKIDVDDSGSTKSKRDPLDNKAVSTTVSANKPRLQRCYERAIRGQTSPTAVRMNVSISVTASGRVSSVDVAGSGPGGLRECMEASIRRWRFPASSDGGPAEFPIVFSAN
jgi:predicted Zn finger-like uncharacterized protein